MERVQAAVASASAEPGAACISCHSAVEGPRCSHCGASQVAGAYRVVRVIAQTAHSRMYLAQDTSGRKVALKELMFALVPGVEQIAAFEREAAVLRTLSHSQIPSFVQAFTEGTGVGTRLYLAQEFIEGESLAQRVSRQKLTEDEAWNLAEQVLEVLHHLHTRQPRLVHRDVKPANLILRERGPMALVDFGAVRDLARELTHGSTLVGTFGYMPPEQLGGTVDATSDLYALGATLLHGLTSTAPSELLVDGMELKFDHKLQGVSDELRAFLKKLVARRRSERFPSAEAALEALRARGQTVLRADALKRAKALAPSRRFWLALAGGIMGSLAALGALTLYVTEPNSDLTVNAPAAGSDIQIDSTGSGQAARPPDEGEVVPVPGQGRDHQNFWHSAKGIRMELTVGERYKIPLPDVTSVTVHNDGSGILDVTLDHEMIGRRPGQVEVDIHTRTQQVKYLVTVR